MTGSAITTTLIAMIAHAGQEDQAVVTAGRRCVTVSRESLPVNGSLVSYLFRSLRGVVGLSVGSTLVQDTLRYSLRLRLSGDDAQEASTMFGYFFRHLFRPFCDKIVRRVRESLDYLNQLDPRTKAVVIRSYEDALKVTFFTVAMAACATFFSCCLVVSIPAAVVSRIYSHCGQRMFGLYQQ